MASVLVLWPSDLYAIACFMEHLSTKGRIHQRALTLIRRYHLSVFYLLHVEILGIK